MNRAAVIDRLTAERPRLEAMGVKHMYLFGSVAREEARSDSDVDLMVDLDEGPTGRKLLFTAFDVGGIHIELSEILGCKIDLVVRADALQLGRKLEKVARDHLIDVF